MTAVGPVGGILYMVQTFIIESKNMVEVTMVGGTGVGGMDGILLRLSVGSVSKFLSIIFHY